MNEKCWICGSGKANLLYPGISMQNLHANDFAITNSEYGKAADIYLCPDCGFQFCPKIGEVTAFYQDLEDQDYEKTRPERALQARKMGEIIKYYKNSGNLLDVGAGSGIFIEEMRNLGFVAEGIEPSRWLAGEAKKRNLPVKEGIFPDKDIAGQYDIISAIDVLEHVNNPLGFIKDIEKQLKPGGIAVISTPDIGSIAAKIMGKRWWNYRIAHIGYFNRKTLRLACKQAGLQPIGWHRPAWYFKLSYLLYRLDNYIPGMKNISGINALQKITLPLNLFDSWLLIAKKN